jgi:hypothetical protein
MKRNLVKIAALFLLLAIVTSSTGCDNAEFQDQIGEFQKAMSESRSSIETYYLEINQFERDLYILQRQLDGKQAGVKYDKPLVFDSANMYVNGPFSTDSIQARLDALRLIEKYGARLAALAGTDAPTRFADNTSALGTNLVNLSNTFRKLSKSEPAEFSAANFITPISRLVGIVGKLYLENKRDRALIESIREGSKYITIINYYLKKDFERIIDKQRESGLKQTINALVVNYNKTREAADREARREMLQEINDVVRTYELFSASKPSAIVDQMEDANQALLGYVNSGRNKADLAQMVARFAEFRDYAEQVANNIKEIKEIRRNLKNAD